MLLEAMLAFRDKDVLLAGTAQVMKPGGRFACTVEAGPPLTADERSRMPDADTVWPTELPDLTALMRDVRLTVSWIEEHTSAHYVRAAALLRAFRAHASEITRFIGARALAELIAAHELWTDWLGRGRVRKFAIVAEKR
jgi:hypothetical protein